MKCGICNSINLKFLFKTKDHDNISQKYYSLYECNKCHTISIQQIPSEKELEKYYSDSYYTYKYYGLLNKYFLWLRTIKMPKKGSVLDIGCGDGSFLKALKEKGYECYGLETSSSGIKKAKSKGLTIYKDIKKIRRKFDVITLWHVLEHITTPISYLSQIKRLLKKDSYLVIAIPNFDSIQSKIGRDAWFHLAPPLHIFHYTPKTIGALLKRVGFKVVRIEHFSLEYNPFGYLQTFLNLLRIWEMNILYKMIRRNSFKFNKSAMILLMVPVLAPISILMSIIEALLKKGGTIVVYAKKQN